MPDVDKVLFVVDRKDLDYQTMREYDRFEKGAANSNTSTRVLKKQLEDPSARIIITTIQKLATFIAANKGHAIYDGHVVIIFDECHRSQFGDMHTAITQGVQALQPVRLHRHADLRGQRRHRRQPAACAPPSRRSASRAAHLHDRRRDQRQERAAVPHRLRQHDQAARGLADKQVSAIDTERALLAPERMRQVVDYTLEHFDQKTNARLRTRSPTRDRRRRSGQSRHGFNALFATASIEAAKRYYTEFQNQQEDLPPGPAAEGRADLLLRAERRRRGRLPRRGRASRPMRSTSRSRDFLDDAIQDYNAMFGTSYDTSADKFQNYYKDLSLRLKNREIDLVIVVNMFLTGFDATTLNTLWVDKRLVATA